MGTQITVQVEHHFGDYFGLLSDPHGDGLDIPDDEKKQLLQQQQSLLANLFASISAVNAAYVQLQVAQSSCDLESIQSGDGAVVAELRRISELKRSYFRNQFDLRTNPIVHPALSAQLQELKTSSRPTGLPLASCGWSSILRTLRSSNKRERPELWRPSSTPTFPSPPSMHSTSMGSVPPISSPALRYAFKSIRSVVQLMVKEMEYGGWDVDAATGSIPTDLAPPEKPRTPDLRVRTLR
ncbi:hypothetical protein BHE74_00006628 [Ensete ventricosum]|nr:hypothetical protein BHE74_00006628 [Ensete ventricosum]